MSDSLRTLVGVDRTVHEPARLAILALLHSVRGADFLYLQRETGLTKGNLSSHLSRLEQAGYLKIDKSFQGRIPRTVCRITPAGRKAFEDYCRSLLGVLR
jgi:DNA-binding MarR family transcriptional regulator